MRLAESLRAASVTPQAPAGTIVSQSPLASFARGIAGGVGDYQERIANQTLAKDAADRQKFLSSAVQQYGSDPKMLAQALMTQPSTVDAGLGLYGDAIKGDQMTAYQAAMLGLQGQKFNAEYPVDPRTGMPKKEQKMSVRDEIEISKARDASDKATSTLNQINAITPILQRYETSKATPAIGFVGQIANAVGLASPETQNKIKDFETLTAASKKLGVEALQMFGGNDTDKELRTAIETEFSVTDLPATSLEKLNRQRAAISVLEQKPAFMEEWVQKNGGLNRPDFETGETFTTAWKRTQKELYRQTLGMAANSTAPASNPALSQEEIDFLRSQGIDPNAAQ